MPIYSYQCLKCSKEFDDLKELNEIDDATFCTKCGGKSMRKIGASSISVKGGSSNETVDMTIGRAAEKVWQGYHDRWSKRRKGKKEIMTKTNQPIMEVGSKDEKKVRKEYSSALQTHRAEMKKKGVPQFDGPGTF